MVEKCSHRAVEMASMGNRKRLWTWFRGRKNYKQFVRLKTGSWGQSTQQVAGFDGVSSFTHHSA